MLRVNALRMTVYWRHQQPLLCIGGGVSWRADGDGMRITACGGGPPYIFRAAWRRLPAEKASASQRLVTRRRA